MVKVWCCHFAYAETDFWFSFYISQFMTNFHEIWNRDTLLQFFVGENGN